MSDAIGGYFELELRKGQHYHQGAIKLNSARNCFEYVLRSRHYRKVWMPHYTCPIMFEPLKKLGIGWECYHIDEHLEPAYLPKLQDGEAFLYTNYFGLKQKCVKRLADLYGDALIVDNAQAFYEQAIEGIDTFYSPRKFFGVPDGGYLYTTAYLDEEFPQARSVGRMNHLLKRVECGAEAGYQDYQCEEESLNGRQIESMSKLTDLLLQSIDYDESKRKRIENFEYVASFLHVKNKLALSLEDGAVPLAYPFLTCDTTLRKRLISDKVFVATYWNNIDESLSPERDYKNILPLPVDQRYNREHMDNVLECCGVCELKHPNENQQIIVSIRPLIKEDAKKSYMWRNDKEVFNYTGNTYSNYISYETELEWIERVIKRENEYRCAILANGTYVGNIYLTDITEESGEYQVFIGDKEYWGKGVAYQASLQILQYAFSTLHLSYVYLQVNELNEKAIKLYNKLGFVLKEKNNGWLTMVKYSNLN